MKTLLLYLATALAEIVGCYLPWLWLRQGGSVLLLVPAAPKHACASKAAKPRRRTHSCAYVELRRMKSHCLSRVQTVTNRVV